MTDRELAILIRRSLSLVIIAGGAALAWWLAGWPAAVAYVVGLAMGPVLIIVQFLGLADPWP